jgi:hypothetical protein
MLLELRGLGLERGFIRGRIKVRRWPNRISIQARCSARCSALAGCSGLACVSSRYFEDHGEFDDSVLADQQHRRLAERRYFQEPVWLALESSIRSSGTPFSVSAISARCT